MNKIYFTAVLFFSSIVAQSIQINEVVSSNQYSYYDEDGDTPDWIELYNPTSLSVSLFNWGLSDDLGSPFQWRFPNISLGPEQYLMVMASDKDRIDIISHWETIIDWGDDWSYFVGNQEPPTSWNQLGFNANNWNTGPSGFGYGDNDDNTIINSATSIYIVKPFFIDNPEQVKKIALHIDYDDGFVAYLNGSEFARSNVLGNPPSHDQGTEGWIEANMYNGGSPSLYWVDSLETWVNDGQNVLAIQVHNFDSNSSDMSCIPFFTIGRNVSLDNNPNVAEEVYLPGSMLHTNFKISSSGETIVLTDLESVLVDSLFTQNLLPDVSIGRVDDEDNIGMFISPTPGAPNGEESVLGVLGELSFSYPTGFYNNQLMYIEIYSNETDVDIYYTLDGSEPDENSYLYSSAIPITENKVIRATSYKSGWMTSPIKTSTYILDDESHDFPTLFLSTAPENFFDYNTGIYVMGPNASSDYPHFGANFWEDWEKPIYIELLETNEEYFSSPAGVKIFGGWSRGQDQKSFSIFARGEYGANEFAYPLFPNLDVDSYQSVVLRNSGNDWNFTMLRDGYMTGIFEDIDLEIQAYRPMLVYLNGEFWGLYNLREKVNEHFIASHHPVDPDELDLIEVQTANEGTIDNYNALINYVENSDMENSDVYDSLSNWIDIDNHIDYNIAQIFIDNRDWPGNNIKYWRPQAQDGLWRWILYDTDFGFGIPWMGLGYDFNTLEFATEENGPGWPNPPWSTFLLRKMLENSDYRERFVTIFSDRLNTIFKPQHLVARLDSLASYIQDIIPIHQNRWPNSAQDWGNHIQIIDNFADNRYLYMRQHLSAFFDLSSPVYLLFNVLSTGGGKIQINTIMPDDYPWGGYYYPDIPIDVRAVAEAGYIFSGWAQFPDSSETMKLQVSDGLNLTAIFEPFLGGDTIDLVINEINYNSSDEFNPGDWIEIYNNGTDSVNISGWYFTDENEDHRYTFPENSIVGTDSYIVLSQDTNSFSTFFPETMGVYGSFDFGLSGGGEEISLYDLSGGLIDQVEYDDSSPWPIEPDGNGPTLELISPNSSNELASSWSFSQGNGTPGYINSVIEPLQSDDENTVPITHLLHSVFPNPFNSMVQIRFNISKYQNIEISILNILGETVRTLVNSQYSPGLNTLVWDGKNDYGHDLSTGVYLCRLKTKNYNETIKLLLVK